MKKNVILTITILVLLPSILLLVFLIAGVKVNNVSNNKEGESYLIALDNVDIKEVEEEIKSIEYSNRPTVDVPTTEAETTVKPAETKPEDKTEKESKTEATTEKTTEKQTEKPTEAKTEAPTPAPTEPKTEAPTPAPTEPPTDPVSTVITPVGGVNENGFVYSAIGSYNPYSYDADKAVATANALANGSITYREVFANSAFVGDSVMDGFDCYMHFPITFTAVGASMKKHLPTVIDSVIDSYPDYIFIRYGLNEMDTTELAATNFANIYKTYIKKLKDNLPYTKIIVIGLTPVGQAAIEKSSRFSNVAMYNAKVKAMCVEIGVAFYENSSLFLAHPELYSNDGVHLGPEMYKIWLRDMVSGLGIY